MFDKEMQNKCILLGTIISGSCIVAFIKRKNDEKQKKEDERLIEESTLSLKMDFEKDLQNRLQNKLQNYRNEED